MVVRFLLVALVLSVGGAAHGKAKAKAKAKAAAPQAETPQAAPVAEAPAAAPSAAAAAAAMAAPVAKFEEAALYTITTTVGGAEYALTFIPTDDPEARTIINNASKSKVVLQKLTGAPAQQWQPHPGGIEPPGFLLFTRLTDEGNKQLHGVLRLMKPDRRFIDDDNYYDKHNRLSVSTNLPETVSYWYIVKLSNGKYRMMSLLGHPNELNKSGETWPEKWDQTRWLEAVKSGAQVNLRHREAADTPAQEWTFTKVGTYFYE